MAVRRGVVSCGWLARFTALICIMCAAVSTHAQELISSSYITPFPQTERYQVRVLGDWLGAGLAVGLQDAFKQEASVQITDGAKSNFGLARPDQNELSIEADRLASGGTTQIAIIMIGINDRQYLRTKTGLSAPGSAEWKEAYGKEAEKFIKKLKAANIAVYWVGLPITGNTAYNDTLAAINDAVRQAAYLNGVKFIETWNGFTDQRGGYSAFGPDLTGQSKRLREADGIGLTAVGSRKLANYVEVVLRRDLAQARSQRNIPLAGDEEEQTRVVPSTVSAGVAATSGLAKDAVSGPLSDPTGSQTATDGSAALQQTGSEFGRRDSAAYSSGFSQGELILSDMSNGLTAIAVISSATDFTARDIQRQTPLSERLYYRVLSKGEALSSKPGRGDDFTWVASSPEKAR